MEWFSAPVSPSGLLNCEMESAARLVRRRLPKIESGKTGRQRTGIRGEAFAYWYLQELGYVFVARNYTPRGGAKDEVDLIDYEGETLAFVEVRMPTVGEKLTALPELSLTAAKQHVVARTAQRFLAERHVKDMALRFDVLAIDNIPGSPPEVRLHKDAFSPQM